MVKKKLATLLLSASCCSAAYAAEKPNIVFVLADDQGWTDLGFMGDPFYETPNIDALAKGGMVFTDAYTCGPNSAPTRASFISGMYTPRHKIYTPAGYSKADLTKMKLFVPTSTRYFRGKKKRISGLTKADYKKTRQVFEVRTALDPKVVSIAEVLGSAGYRTARFGKWHVGKDTQGFDVSSGNNVPGNEKHMFKDPDSAEVLTEVSINFMRECKAEDKPFFLFLSHYEVHTPLVAHKHLVKKYKNKLQQSKGLEKEYNPTYAAMVEALDTSVGTLMKEINELGIAENTLVIFASDNGGTGNSDNRPLRGGKGSLWEGGIRVPTAMYWPGVIQAGTQNDTPFTSVDYLPTFASLAGAKLPDQIVDGVDISETFLKGASPKQLKERPLYWHFPLYLSGGGKQTYEPYPGGTYRQGKGWRTTPVSVIRQGDWKLLEYFEGEQLKLYNLKHDLGENNNLVEQEPEIASRLHEQLKAWRKETGAPEPRMANPYFKGY